MHDVNHAIDFLRERTGLSQLALDHDGHAELIFDGNYAVDLYRIDARQLELCSILDQPAPGAPTRETLVALLTANYLGDGTGAGRIALDPRNQNILLCERLDVTTLDASAFERRVLDFVAHVAVWNSGKLDDLLEGGASPASNRIELADSTVLIRG
jgi:hypothetical protein